MKERLEIARRALDSFQELLAIEHPSLVERDAAIQRFEYTCEAVWKAAQRFLLVVEGVGVGSPKGCVRACRDVGLLTDDQAVVGLEMVDDRNRTVHTYNEAVAKAIFRNLRQYADLLERHEWACFAAHQAAEKAVKALHLHMGQEAWGHVVATLLRELPKSVPVPKELLEKGRVLDNFYIPPRYPNSHPEGAPFVALRTDPKRRVCRQAGRGNPVCP